LQSLICNKGNLSLLRNKAGNAGIYFFAGFGIDISFMLLLAFKGLQEGLAWFFRAGQGGADNMRRATKWLNDAERRCGQAAGRLNG
jgi:hypothetical protein